MRRAGIFDFSHLARVHFHLLLSMERTGMVRMSTKGRNSEEPNKKELATLATSLAADFRARIHTIVWFEKALCVSQPVCPSV